MLALLSLVLGAVVALIQKDVKRMMAYSSINHAGFILLGVEAATARGVSASLYYVFTYMFLVIGSFAVITVMARDGDTGHQITDYRGLAKRQPLLALAFAVLLLGQAGAPFTTGFLAKFGVVGASVATHAYVLAVGGHGRRRPWPPSSTCGWPSPCSRRWARSGDLPDGDQRPSGVDRSPPPVTTPRRRPAASASASTDRPSRCRCTSLQVLTDAPPAEAVTDRGPVPVPALTSLAIGYGGLHRGVRDHPRPRSSTSPTRPPCCSPEQIGAIEPVGSATVPVADEPGGYCRQDAGHRGGDRRQVMHG